MENITCVPLLSIYLHLPLFPLPFSSFLVPVLLTRTSRVASHRRSALARSGRLESTSARAHTSEDTRYDARAGMTDETRRREERYTRDTRECDTSALIVPVTSRLTVESRRSPSHGSVRNADQPALALLDSCTSTRQD